MGKKVLDIDDIYDFEDDSSLSAEYFFKLTAQKGQQKMTQENLNAVLAAHKLWMDSDGANGVYADLRRADLHGANLSGADLRCADLRGAALYGADLTDADLRSATLSGAALGRAELLYADLRSATLSDTDLIDAALGGADLRDADLHGADLRGADLRSAKLSGADLRGANLGGADLRRADLRRAKGLLSAIDYMDAHFERTSGGYIAYKIFGDEHTVPERWRLENGSVINENVNFNRTNECGCGINVAPLEWEKRNHDHETHDIWKVLIRWEWLCGVCVPYNTTGKIRCERVELVEKVYG